MKLRTVDLLRSRFNDKRNNSAMLSKQLESRLVLELRDKLTKYLADNDYVALEVNKKVLSEFINILSESFLSVYNMEQIDANKYIFSHREINM